MKSEITPPAISVETTLSKPPYIDFHAVVAGALLSAALAFIFITFGAGIGLSMASPFGSDASGVGITIAVSLWTLWLTVSSVMIGAYVAGRMRPRIADASDHEVEVRDGVHGLVVWALATLLGALITAYLASGVAKTGAELAGAGASAFAASAAAGQGSDRDEISLPARTLMRSAQYPSLGDVEPLLARAAESGELSGTDRQYLIDVVVARSGATQNEAASIVDAAAARAKLIADNAKDVAEKARKAGVLLSFLTAASLLVSAAGAWWAAARGGLHRDLRTDFSRLTGYR